MNYVVDNTDSERLRRQFLKQSGSQGQIRSVKAPLSGKLNKIVCRQREIINWKTSDNFN